MITKMLSGSYGCLIPTSGIMALVVRVRPLMASASAWTVGAVVSVAVGLVSLSLIQTGLTADKVQPFARDAATDAGSPAVQPSAIATTPDTSAAPSAAPPVSGERLLTSKGGNVVARCRDGAAYLVYWSPAQGYHGDDVVRGPAAVAKVTFGKQQREVKLFVTCADNVPQAVVNEEEIEDGGVPE